VERELSRLREQVDQLREALDRIESGQDRITEMQADAGTRVRRTQALTARTYEALAHWPELIEQARAAGDYELAFSATDPLVSIPIPTYHSPDTLCERALASVQAQTHSRWEAIVVGDHCTDDTAERVEALRDERIRFINLPVRENDPEDPWERWAVKGSVPRSVGIAQARGRWIAPLSHDDAWDPNHLELLLAAARESGAEVVYSRMRLAAAGGGTASGSIGAFPPRHGDFAWQAAIFHGGFDFLRYDRNCAFASEPNDWNLARRAWEAGVRFHHVPAETATLFVTDRMAEIANAQRERGLPPSASAGHA
jgi:glycosyltransferase involved in cell wall biosynthesis